MKPTVHTRLCKINASSVSVFCTVITCLLITLAIFNPLSGNSQQLVLTAGSKLVSNGNASLVLHNASIKNNGTFIAGTGTVVFAGNADTTSSYISGNSNTTLYNLSVSKAPYGVAIKSPVGVRSVLTMQTGNLYADSNLTLLSDANLTARLAPVPPTCDVFGKATVERYIPAHRAWRLMTAPVTNSSTIRGTWQNDGVYTPGRGTMVSNPSMGPGIDTNTNASLKTWNPATQVLVAVNNTIAPISAGNSGSADNTGYFVFVRGDRSPGNIGLTGYNSTTLSGIGKLQTGSQTFNVSSVLNNYSLVGNPYASPLDFNAVTRSNLVKRFYAWDPSLNSVGGYVMLDDIDGDGIFTKSVPASGQTKEIQSSQAFFVQTAATGAASLTINESNKSSVYLNNVFRPAGTLGSRMESLVANLYLPNADGTVTIGDAAIAEFKDNFSEAVDLAQDAIKFGNVNESVAFLRNGTSLAAERRPLISLNDTLFLKLKNTTQRNYRFQFITDGLNHPGLQGFFEDNYLNTSTAVNLNGSTAVDFNIDGNAASASQTRFRIVFRKVFGPLPVTFTTVKAYLQNNDIAVDWKVENEINIVSYDVEKSIDGTHFTKVGNITASGNSNPANNYAWLDVNAVTGNNFYRIKSIDRSMDTKYSQVVKVTKGKKGTGITVYPNPIEHNTINLQFSGQPVGTYQVRLFNTAGQLLYSTEINVNSNNTAQSLLIRPLLPAGTYQLQIKGNDETITYLKILNQ